MRASILVTLALALASLAGTGRASDTPPVEVWLDDALAVTYRARLEGDWLVVEARHEPGWHTYAMDNASRARKRTGKDKVETELPTVITPIGGVSVEGAWRQSEPLDLSTPDIRWYTWGFEGTSYFAARVDEVALPATVRIDGQACTETLCAMVESLEVPVDADEPTERTVDPESLVPVTEP